MDTDDYHHVSDQLHRAANKMNKARLALILQDRDRRPPPPVSESEEEDKIKPLQTYAYDDGEVALKKITSPPNLSTDNDETPEVSKISKGKPEGIDSPSAGVYETPISPIARPTTVRGGLQKGMREDQQRSIETELNDWPVARIGDDGKYYVYDKGNKVLVDNSIIYHPPIKTFIYVSKGNLEKIAQMPIAMDQMIIFRTFARYICFDIVKKPLDDKEDLTWDSFQTVYPNPMVEPPVLRLHSQSDSSKLKSPTNTFGNTVDVSRHNVEIGNKDVDRLLEEKAYLQDQLKDLSGESNEEEEALPKTLGEHQMPYLDGWQSIRNTLANHPYRKNSRR
ncbi:MAG: hypothetical protein MJE68_24980, partial [Proteobacteria bacterium]|nr:hypothetical protein [Pseudomonadota bacterium]